MPAVRRIYLLFSATELASDKSRALNSGLMASDPIENALRTSMPNWCIAQVTFLAVVDGNKICLERLSFLVHRWLCGY